MSVNDPKQLKTYLETSRTIAVVGLSPRPEATSHRVASFLQDRGYRIVPVNPRALDQTILGETVYPDLVSIPFAVDIVDVFRRSEFLPQVAQDFVQARGKIFWAQLGLSSPEAEEILRQAGVQDVVMDRCIKVDYLNLMEE